MGSLRGISGGLVLGALCALSMALPNALAAQSAPTKDAAKLQAEVSDTGSDITAARARQVELQAKVDDLEKRNAAQQQQLQERDAEIAALQKQLQDAGVPAKATTANP